MVFKLLCSILFNITWELNYAGNNKWAPHLVPKRNLTTICYVNNPIE